MYLSVEGGLRVISTSKRVIKRDTRSDANDKHFRIRRVLSPLNPSITNYGACWLFAVIGFINKHWLNIPLWGRPNSKVRKAYTTINYFQWYLIIYIYTNIFRDCRLDLKWFWSSHNPFNDKTAWMTTTLRKFAWACKRWRTM